MYQLRYTQDIKKCNYYKPWHYANTIDILNADLSHIICNVEGGSLDVF